MYLFNYKLQKGSKVKLSHRKSEWAFSKAHGNVYQSGNEDIYKARKLYLRKVSRPISKRTRNQNGNSLFSRFVSVIYFLPLIPKGINIDT